MPKLVLLPIFEQLVVIIVIVEEHPLRDDPLFSDSKVLAWSLLLDHVRIYSVRHSCSHAISSLSLVCHHLCRVVDVRQHYRL
jgi:hypothetical protein